MAESIFISEYLKKTDRGRLIFKQLKAYEADGYFDIKEIPLNKNEWCRDYMPVISSTKNSVLFKYAPAYLQSSKIGIASIPPQKDICSLLKLQYIDSSKIVLDGGAIEIYGKKGMISEKFLKQNGDVNHTLSEIKEILELDTLIVVPPDPWDFTGHVDGLVRFIDDKTVLVNNYKDISEQIVKASKYIRQKYDTWRHQFNKALSDAGLKTHELVSGFSQNKKETSAKGIYLNFLRLDNVIVMPVFSELANQNEEASEMLEKFYNTKVLKVEADKLSEYGGSINCITWSKK